MRIFISSIDDSGSRRTTRLTLPDCTTTSSLIRQICRNVGINKICAIIKLKCQPYNLRIIENWPLSHYPIKNGSTFIVNYNQCNEPESTLDKIQEESQVYSDEENNVKLSFMSGKGQVDDSRYFQQCLEKLIKAVINRQLDDVSSILKEEPCLDDQKELERLMLRKVTYLLNQLGDCGKNALHCAIQTANIDIVSFFLIKGTNPAILTIDQYSPLQLAVQKGSPDIMKLLLLQQKTDVNQVTSQSTALHLAVLNENMDCLEVLLQNDIDIDTIDETGKRAIDVCSNSNMRKLLMRKAQLVKTGMPYITKGNIYKVSSFTYSIKQIILVLNPFKKQLTISNASELGEKLSLHELFKVQPVQNRKWLMSDQIYYIQIFLKKKNKQILLGLRHEKIYRLWLSNFQKAIKYVSNSIFNKEVPVSEQIVEYLNDEKGQATLHRRKTQATTSRRQMSIMNLKLESQIEQLQNTFKDKSSTDINQIKTIDKESSMLSQDLRLRESDIVLGSVIDFKPKSSISSLQPLQSSEETDVTPMRSENIFRKNSYQKILVVPEFKVQKVNSQKHEAQQHISFRDFTIIRLLGNGAFGQVYLARHRSTNEMFALKVLSKPHLIAKRQLRYAVGEASILKKMDSPFIIKLHYAFQTPKHLYMALDNCNNGDLSQLVITKGKLEQNTARFIIAQVILALQYLHFHNILYRDMKPQNILIGKDGYIQLTDFGLSKENDFSMSFCGSPAYLSPEMLEKKGVGFANDIYGIGCVLFELTTGDPPYYDDNLEILYQNIRTSELLYPSDLSIEIKSLISRLLERDANKRLGVKNLSEIKQHDFFKKFSWQLLAQKALPVPPQMFVNDQQSSSYQPVSLQKNETELLDEDYKQEGTAQVFCRIKNFTFIRQSQINNID